MIKIRNQDTLRRLDFKHPATWLATWFGWSEPLMALILFATWVLFTMYIRRAVKLIDAQEQQPA